MNHKSITPGAYLQLCKHYDILTPSEQEMHALIEALEGCHKILIVGIGCGRILIALLDYFKKNSISCELHAVEHNPYFVAYCRTLPELAEAHIHEGNFLEFDESLQFDAVCVPFTTIIIQDFEAQEKWVAKGLRLAKTLVLDLFAEPHITKEFISQEVKQLGDTTWVMPFWIRPSGWYVTIAKNFKKDIVAKRLFYTFKRVSYQQPLVWDIPGEGQPYHLLTHLVLRISSI